MCVCELPTLPAPKNNEAEGCREAQEKKEKQKQKKNTTRVFEISLGGSVCVSDAYTYTHTGTHDGKKKTRVGKIATRNRKYRRGLSRGRRWGGGGRVRGGPEPGERDVRKNRRKSTADPRLAGGR